MHRCALGSIWFCRVDDPAAPQLAGRYSLDRYQGSEICSAHMFNVIPGIDRDLLVAAFYRRDRRHRLHRSDPAGGGRLLRRGRSNARRPVGVLLVSRLHLGVGPPARARCLPLDLPDVGGATSLPHLNPQTRGIGGERGIPLLAIALVLSACSAGVGAPSVTRNEGDGWRQLGVYRTDVPYTVRLAQTEEQLTAELEWHGVTADIPAWDPDQEVIAFFNEGIGSSCPEVAISDITFDGAGRRVYATFSDPIAAAGNTPRACTADLVGSQTACRRPVQGPLAGEPFHAEPRGRGGGVPPRLRLGAHGVLVTLE